MKYAKTLWICTLLPFCLAAAPSQYNQVPKKGEKPAASASSVRDPEVRPEEVYKYGKQEFAIIARDTGYFPERVIVRRNIPVRLYITSASPKSLCFVMDEFAIRRGVANQGVEELNFLPTKAGEYKFYCPVGEIQGKIVVRE